MHPYGTDSNERRNLLVALVPISFWLSAAAAGAIRWAGWGPPEGVDWIFDPASAAAWFGVLYLYVERRVWRWSWLHRIGFVETPDLNGTWDGTLRTSWDQFREERRIHLIIRQSWTRIVVELRTS